MIDYRSPGNPTTLTARRRMVLRIGMQLLGRAEDGAQWSAAPEVG
jgi:hypothetical protein